MANIVNQYGQVKVGIRTQAVSPALSSLLASLYAVYNADSTGLASLKTSLYAAYNGESNANDSFGSNNGTAVGGLTYAAGKIGQAFNFNGTNAYVSLPNNSLNFTGDFSYSAWVYFFDVPTGERYIITTTNGNATNTDFGVGFGMLSGQLLLGVYNNTNLSAWKSDTTLTPLTWYHVTVTKKVSNAPKFYINGTLRTTTLLVGTNTLNPAYTSGAYPNSLATIGAYRYNNGSTTYGYCNANIDAVNFWQKELTQSEITDLYNSGNGSQYITDSFYKPTTNDALGTNNGTAQGGLTYGVGKVGTAFQFNGTNSYILLPTGSIHFTNSFTVNMWVYITSNPTQNKGLLCDYYYSGADYGYASYIKTTGQVELFFLGTGNTTNVITSSSSLTLNAWNMVSFSWDKPNTKWTLYLNNTPAGSYTGSNASSLQYGGYTGDRANIGAINSSPSGVSNVLNGLIDATSVWNKALTVSEITELYNSGNGKQYPN